MNKKEKPKIQLGRSYNYKPKEEVKEEIKPLVIIKFHSPRTKEQENLDALNEFARKTNLNITGEVKLCLDEKRFFGDTLALFFVHDDWISVDTNRRYHNRIKRFFEDFVKIYPIQVNIKVQSRMEDY